MVTGGCFEGSVCFYEEQRDDEMKWEKKKREICKVECCEGELIGISWYTVREEMAVCWCVWPRTREKSVVVSRGKI